MEVRGAFLSPAVQGSVQRPSPLAHSQSTPTSCRPAANGLEELERKYPAEAGRSSAAGRQGVVYHARSRPGGREVAIKRQADDDAAHRELRILQHLNSRIAEQRNFVFVLDWTKCLVPAGPPCMHLVLEQAGTSLRALLQAGLELDVTSFRLVLFQLLYALHQAQAECEFVHNDLHLGNVLLRTHAAGRHVRYAAPALGEDFLVDGRLQVKIVDFGLSRITLPSGEVVCNRRNPQALAFLPGADVEKLALELRGCLRGSYVDRHLQHAQQEEREANERENRRAKASLSRQMTKGLAPSLLLQHPFFAPLRSSAVCRALGRLPDASQFLSPVKVEAGKGRKGRRRRSQSAPRARPTTPMAASGRRGKENTSNRQREEKEKVEKVEKVEVEVEVKVEVEVEVEASAVRTPAAAPATPVRRSRRLSKRLTSSTDVEEESGQLGKKEEKKRKEEKESERRQKEEKEEEEVREVQRQLRGLAVGRRRGRSASRRASCT